MTESIPNPQSEKPILPSLIELTTPELTPHLKINRYTYPRKLPDHYISDVFHAQNQQEATVNILSVENPNLIIPQDEESLFTDFMQGVRNEQPELARQIISPGGTAKSAANKNISPIKLLTDTVVGGKHLPGDEELYGWNNLAQCATQNDSELILQLQVNGLYFNYGSILFDGKKIIAPQDEWRAEAAESNLPEEIKRKMGINEGMMKRPQPLIIQQKDATYKPYIFTYHDNETVLQGLKRLERELTEMNAQAAFGASPAFVVPNEHNNPSYLTVQEGLVDFQANDVRHYIFCPYFDGPFMFPELSRIQSLDPKQLVNSLSGNAEDRVVVELDESFDLMGKNIQNIEQLLNRVGYQNRYSITAENGKAKLEINLLEGVYSHIIPAVRKNGELEILQTSGTHGNISGQDGMTYNQTVDMIRSLNSTQEYLDNPITMAFSGSQGNDVPNIVVKGNNDQVNIIEKISPQTALSEVSTKPRGRVTTPRIGIGVKKNLS